MLSFIDFNLFLRLSCMFFSVLLLVLVVEPSKVLLMAFLQVYFRSKVDVRDWITPIPEPCE